MKRCTFVKAVEQNRVHLIKLLIARKATLDEACSIVHATLVMLFNKRAWKLIDASILDQRVYTYLRQAVLNVAKDQYKKKLMERAIVGPVDEDSEENYSTEFFVGNELTLEDIECPFCFRGNLNMYGACALCQTILGKGSITHKKQFALAGADHERWMNTKIDVRHAISLLTEFEQLVVTQVIDGQQTLAMLAGQSSYRLRTLERTWNKAKCKLANILAAYDTSENPSVAISKVR